MIVEQNIFNNSRHYDQVETIAVRTDRTRPSYGTKAIGWRLTLQGKNHSSRSVFDEAVLETARRTRKSVVLRVPRRSTGSHAEV